MVCLLVGKRQRERQKETQKERERDKERERERRDVGAREHGDENIYQKRIHLYRECMRLPDILKKMISDA